MPDLFLQQQVLNNPTGMDREEEQGGLRIGDFHFPMLGSIFITNIYYFCKQEKVQKLNRMNLFWSSFAPSRTLPPGLLILVQNVGSTPGSLALVLQAWLRTPFLPSHSTFVPASTHSRL